MAFSISLRVAMMLVGVAVGVASYREGAGQYHIQTDEGPDRYFRYQTYNGQFRKEKRLDDGTVYGTYGWIDPTGLLRLYDYAAGKEGYRLVRERERQVAVPKVPDPVPKVVMKNQLFQKRKPTRVRTRVRPLGPAPPQNILKTPGLPVSTSLREEDTSATLSTSLQEGEPSAALSNSLQHSLKAESVDTLFGTVSPPKAEVPAPDGIILTTSRGRPRTRQRVRVSAKRKPHEVHSSVKQTPDQVRSSANSLKSIESSGATQRQAAAPSAVPASAIDPVKFPRLPPLPPGARYTIRYDLGQQFHEEQTLADGSRIGRHGYVDPFGILRVTYYNTDSAGHLHQRKESRWVGSRQVDES